MVSENDGDDGEKLISRRGWREKAYFTTGMTGTSLFHDGDKLILWWWEAHHSWWENIYFLLNLCYKCWWILKRKIMHCGAYRKNNQAFSWTFNGLVKNCFFHEMIGGCISYHTTRNRVCTRRRGTALIYFKSQTLMQVKLLMLLWYVVSLENPENKNW